MKPKVLIVDDALFIREILSQLCLTQGWEVVAQAESGDEAIKKAMEFRPEVIFMDLVLPGKNGIEVTKIIHEKMPNTNIIGISTLDSEDIMVRALEAGCCHFIVKPFKSIDIINAVNSVLAESKEIQHE